MNGVSCEQLKYKGLKMQSIKIEFFHDVICSFCFPMSFRMRKLQEMMPHVEIIHRSFALVKHENDFAKMFGSREKAKNEILSHWAHANQNDDLHRFNIEGMRKESFLFPMSMKPLWACKAASSVAGNSGYWDLFDALQDALFVKNKNIELDDIIFESVKRVGLDFAQWQELFKSEKVKLAVEADFKMAERYGLKGVPALVINEKTVVGGAVPLEHIKQLVEQEHAQLGLQIPAGSTCGIGGCPI